MQYYNPAAARDLTRGLQKSNWKVGERNEARPRPRRGHDFAAIGK
jgi:hypothetical protein